MILLVEIDLINMAKTEADIRAEALGSYTAMQDAIPSGAERLQKAINSFTTGSQYGNIAGRIATQRDIEDELRGFSGTFDNINALARTAGAQELKADSHEAYRKAYELLGKPIPTYAPQQTTQGTTQPPQTSPVANAGAQQTLATAQSPQLNPQSPTASLTGGLGSTPQTGNMTTGSVVDYLNSVGKNSSYQARAILAQNVGIQGYTGTAAQNTQLLSALRGSQPTQPSQQTQSFGGGDQLTQAKALLEQTQAQGATPFAGSSYDTRSNPASTGQPTTPTTATGETETSNIIKVWSDVSKQLGISDIQGRYTKTVDESKALQDKKDVEALEINNNPWFSEGKRQMELKKLDSKYETKLNTLSNYAKLYDAQYQEAVATAKFLTTGIQDDQQFALNLAQKKQEAIDALGKDNAIVSANGRELLVNKATGQIVADLGASKDTTINFGGNISSVTGKPLSDTERVAQGYAQRMIESDRIISQFGSQFASPTSFGGALPSVLQSSERQSYEQAKRDFINATLRKESGAAIQESEFNSADKQYFPQAGDSPQVVSQKATNRQLKINALKLEGGLSGDAQTSGSNPSVDSYLKSIGY